MKERCPHCDGWGWYEVTYDYYLGYEVVLRCLCGYHRVLYSEANDTVHMSVPKKIQRPLRPRSRLSKCLTEIARVHPAPISTSDLASIMKVEPQKVSQYLIVLRVKGFAQCVDKRMGVTGGSKWGLSALGKKMMKI